MGRVKRYKKIKACDPFAPKRADPDAGGGKRKAIEYDMPPEDSDSEGQSKKRRKQEKLWERDALRDDEYMQMLEANAKQRKEKKLEIEPRKANESMKAFKFRIRTETQAALRESFVANSSTKNRRREFMKEKKKRKKLRKAGQLPDEGEGDDEREMEALRGHRGQNARGTALGATNDAPPDLRAFQKPVAKPAAAAVAAPPKVKKAPRPRADDSVREEAIRAYSVLREARKLKNTTV